MYANIDSWKWFEVRNLDNFLINFKPVFFCLKDIDITIKEEKMFEEFWSKCEAYLEKIGHGNIPLLMEADGAFRRSSYNHWTKSYQRQQEGLDFMYKAFKACFGIIGNDDYCQNKYGEGLNYSWQKMENCVDAVENEAQEFIIEEKDPEEYRWSEKNRALLKQAKKRLGDKENI